MAAITMDMIKEIREKTGAGIADCKKALNESNGDMEGAVEFLRKAGIAKAEKKAGRAVKEGLIVTKIQNGVAAMVELLCETDFVAKNEKFAALADAIADSVLGLSGEGCMTEAAQQANQAALTALIATIGENMQLRRAARWVVKGEAGTYIHGGGKIGVLAEGQNTDSDFLREVCMHIAAFNPQYIIPSDIPAEVEAKEREIAAALPDLANKPDQIKGKIIDGRIHKWYSEVCLMDQPWYKEQSSSLAKLKPGITISRFLRWGISDEI